MCLYVCQSGIETCNHAWRSRYFQPDVQSGALKMRDRKCMGGKCRTEKGGTSFTSWNRLKKTLGSLGLEKSWLFSKKNRKHRFDRLNRLNQQFNSYTTACLRANFRWFSWGRSIFVCKINVVQGFFVLNITINTNKMLSYSIETVLQGAL